MSVELKEYMGYKPLIVNDTEEQEDEITDAEESNKEEAEQGEK